MNMDFVSKLTSHQQQKYLIIWIPYMMWMNVDEISHCKMKTKATYYIKHKIQLNYNTTWLPIHKEPYVSLV